MICLFLILLFVFESGLGCFFCPVAMAFLYYFCSAELAKALQETEHLLGEISVMTRKKAPSVGQCAEVLSGIEHVVEDEVASLSR